MIFSDVPEQKSLSTYTKVRPFLSKIKEKRLLTGSGSTKHTYHVSLCLKDSGIQFRPGDSLAILPQNNPVLVQHLIDALKADREELVVDPRSTQTMTLWDFLSYKANLARLTSSFLKLIYEHEPLHDKKNTLARLLEKENKELLMQYLSAHDPLDVLKEYSEIKAPAQEAIAQFGPLLPRFYSIASSLKSAKDEAHLTVALFTFSHSGEQRFGVASHFLCQMAQEEITPVPLYLQPAHAFFLPEDPTTPIIMVGPGTGIAPFRAFLQERIATGAPGKNWLFFGERNEASDYFYRDYWEELMSVQKLRLTLAFSRDQPEKIYVQHRMQQQGKDLWEWLEKGAYFYVCGDAHKMAKDVDHALQSILREQGGLSEEDAKAYVKTMKAQKRYQTDVY